MNAAGPHTPARWTDWLAPAGLVVVVAASFLLPPLPQDESYHNFADRRTLLGVPYFWNVVSNVPFVLAGLAGIGLLLGGRPVVDRNQRTSFLMLFAGVALTGLGSAYYHLGPTTPRLLWDRLPMTIAFMGLFAAVIGERGRPEIGRVLLAPLLLLGAGTAIYWSLTEQYRTGNLWPYGTVQFYPIIVIPLLVLLRPSPYTRGYDYLIALGFYGLAKALEMGDAVVFDWFGAIGGHPFKHVTAAVGALWVLRMLLLRERRT